MNEMTTTRTPEVIAAEIRALTSTVLSNIIEIGRRFVEAKAMLPHGSFGPWLENSTGYSQRTANNFMRLYDAYGDQQASLFGAVSNSQTFANLPYSKALALLSVPEEEREGFAEEVRADEISLRQLKEEIAKRDARIAEIEQERDRVAEDLAAAKEDADDLASRLDETAEIAERQAQELDELRNQPMDVAVREPSEEELGAIVADRLKEVNEIHAQELASADAERQKVENDLMKARKDARALKDKIKNAEADHKKALEQERVKAADEAKGQLEKLNGSLLESKQKVQELTAQLESARKQAAMADEAAIAFKAAFGQWQRAHADMEAALERAAPETAKKLRAAMAAQMDVWGRD